MDLEINIDSYLRNRLDQYQNWYDKKAVLSKRKYLQGRIWSAIGAVLVPIITNISFPNIDLTENYFLDPGKVLVTIISSSVALLIALEGVLHHREQWKNYRTTEQYLTAQKHLFINSVGDYSNLERKEAFKLLVTRIENAITEENAITLNVLTKIDNGNKGNG